jgi:hypothetical protein
VEEINLENNDEQDFHCVKKECFQDIVGESKFLDVIRDKERNESLLKLEIPYPIKYGSNLEQPRVYLEQPRVYFIESWFQIIVIQAMQSDSQNILFC